MPKTKFFFVLKWTKKLVFQKPEKNPENWDRNLQKPQATLF